MAVEVECARCDGRLLVETPGIVVACPHCGTHLMIPDTGPADAFAEQPAAGEAVAQRPGASSSIITREPVTHEAAVPADDSNGSREVAPESVDTSAEPVEHVSPAAAEIDAPDKDDSASWYPGLPTAGSLTLNNDDAVFPGLPAAADTPPSLLERPDAAASGGDDLAGAGSDMAAAADPSDSSTALTEFSLAATAAAMPAIAVIGETSEPAASSANSSQPQSAGRENQETSAPRSSTAATATGRPVVSRSLFVMVAGYASAVTIALIYLVFLYMSRPTHQLEHLPDVVPEYQNGKLVRQLYPEYASMPDGHTLELGESGRFGNVKVTAVRITRGPAIIVFDDGQVVATEPVFKLWLRLENVSTDQTFAPLSGELLFWHTKDNPTANRPVRANNFLIREEEKRKNGPLVLLYQPGAGDYMLHNQQIGRKLAPRGTMESYLASSDEGLDNLRGRLLWRIHIRKGLNPGTHRGVTTLIEVRFDSKDVRDEAAT